MKKFMKKYMGIKRMALLFSVVLAMGNPAVIVQAADQAAIDAQAAAEAAATL